MTGTRIKGIFLFFYMALAVWKVFYNVYLEDQQFTGTQIGLINAIIQSTLFFVVPFWGIRANQIGIRPILRILILVTAIMIFFLGYIPQIFYVIIYIVIFTFFMHPIGPLNDALAVQFSETNTKYNYGKFKFWGSLGWASASLLSGYLFLYIDIWYIFPVSAVLFLFALVFIGLPRKRKVIYRPDFKPFHFSDLLSNKPLLIFIVIFIVYGIACSPISSFLNLYYTELGGNYKIVGFAYAIQAFSELPFFLIAGFLVNKFGSKKIILFSVFIMLIRLFIYGMFPDITIGLLTGILQGITLSFFLVGMVEYIHKLLPEGLHAIAQTIIWSGYFGVGQSLGNLSIGFLKDTVGMVNIMWIFGTLTIFVFFSMGMFFYFHSEKRKLLKINI